MLCHHQVTTIGKNACSSSIDRITAIYHLPLSLAGKPLDGFHLSYWPYVQGLHKHAPYSGYRCTSTDAWNAVVNIGVTKAMQLQAK